MNKKILFVPGWMFKSDYFKLGQGLNPWEEDIDCTLPRNADILVGHSMGASIAIDIWTVNKDAKLILVDPFVEQKSVLKTMGAWVGFYLKEGGKFLDCLAARRFIFRNFFILCKFPRDNYWDIIKEIPLDKIVILHGVNDLYLSNQKMMQKFKDLGIKVIEVEDAGHNWHANFDKEILKIINS